METPNKKKVSFDIDQKLLVQIKDLCTIKRMKLADFFREAAREKLERDERYISIYVPLDGKIIHFQVDIDLYEVDIFEASEDMKANVNAVCEGVVRFRADTVQRKIDKNKKWIILMI